MMNITITMKNYYAASVSKSNKYCTAIQFIAQKNYW